MLYLNIYSLYITIWIFLSSVTHENKYMLMGVYFIIYPSVFCVFMTFYFTSINQNKLMPGGQWRFLGFIEYPNLQMSYMVMIVLWMLFCFFVRIMRTE